MKIATDRAVSLGVIVTELVTNAFKYAYPAGVHGDIRIRLVCGDGVRCRLTVADDGIGWRGSGATRGSGLGSRIVHAMTSGLGTRLSYENVPAGTCAVLDFEL